MAVVVTGVDATTFSRMYHSDKPITQKSTSTAPNDFTTVDTLSVTVFTRPFARMVKLCFCADFFHLQNPNLRDAPMQTRELLRYVIYRVQQNKVTPKVFCCFLSNRLEF